MLGAMLMLVPGPGRAFEFSFDWGPLERCTTGDPNTVDNPAFALKEVPAGTRVIRFALVDLDAPGYPHGGGLVPYSGQSRILPGAFTYKSPCPPDGRHTYEWRATALSAAGGETLGEARARAEYP